MVIHCMGDYLVVHTEATTRGSVLLAGVVNEVWVIWDV
jgi:hypothetical protein